MKIKFYLVRHGEAEVNKNPLQETKVDALTELGLKQARCLAERFRNMTVQNIYTSKISRALLTAQEIGNAVEQVPIIVDCLKERKVTYIDHHNYSYNEPFADFKARLTDAKTFFENLSQDSVIIVSHALCIRGLIAYIVFGDLLTEELLHKINDVFLIENGAITKLIYDNEKDTWRIDYLNDRTHIV